MMSASDLAARSNLPEPTVAKVLKLLSKADLVQSTRGAQGGYQAVRAAEEMSVAEIVIAVDGPVSLTACVEGGEDTCEYSCACPVKGRWTPVNIAVKSALESISLADMIGPQMGIKKKEKIYKEERVS